MSSLNRIGKSAGRVHRERAQPESRQRLGELEKKKDYKQRSKDYQLKRAAITTLHRKAAERNPDEFYFHMVNSETRDGVHYEKSKKGEEGDKKTKKTVLEARDLTYVRHKLGIERKKIDKLRASLHLTDSAGVSNTRTVFVDDEEEGERVTGKRSTRVHMVSQPYDAVTRTQRATRKAYRELALRIDRVTELQMVLDKMTLHKHLTGGKDTDNPPHKEKEGSATSAPVYKWAYVRKR